MATVNVYYGFDLLDLDLNWFARNYWDSYFLDNSFLSENGITYEDTFLVNGYDFATDLGLLFFGNSFSFDVFGYASSGQVTALGEGFWEGDDIWYAEGVSISFVDLFQAALTVSNSDDFAIVAAALSGADLIDLSDGSDRFGGFDGNDQIYGRFGNDILYGGSGDDDIFGEGDSDTLYGGAGNDLLNGGTGNDWLQGGTGNDQATGGAGADVFAFVAGDGKFVITDFEAGVDDLAFVGLGAGFGVQQLIPFVSQQGNDVVITDGVQEVRFQDTLLSDLSGGDVFFI